MTILVIEWRQAKRVNKLDSLQNDLQLVDVKTCECLKDSSLLRSKTISSWHCPTVSSVSHWIGLRTHIIVPNILHWILLFDIVDWVLTDFASDVITWLSDSWSLNSILTVELLVVKLISKLSLIFNRSYVVRGLIVSLGFFPDHSIVSSHIFCRFIVETSTSWSLTTLSHLQIWLIFRVLIIAFDQGLVKTRLGCFVGIRWICMRVTDLIVRLRG